MEGRVSADTSRPPPGSANYIHLLVKPLDGKIRNLVQKETNHARPHFHTKAPGACDVSVDIETAEILAGNCRRHRRIVRRWAFAEQERLMALRVQLYDGASADFGLRY